MTPIICVGEPQPTTSRLARDHVLKQARTALSLVPKADRRLAVIAYEPVWAIGEGARAADPGHIGAVHLGLPELRARAFYPATANPPPPAPLLPPAAPPRLSL